MKDRAQFFCQRLSGEADGPALAAGLGTQPRGVALSGDWAAGSALLSSHPLCVASSEDDPFALLDRLPFELNAEGAVEGAVGGGWFGWLGFGLARVLEPIPPPPPRLHVGPLFDLAFHDHVVRRDRDGQWWFEALWTEARSELLDQRLVFWQQQLSSATPVEGSAARATTTLSAIGAGLRGHQVAVAETIARIAAGEFSQANICMAFEGAFDGDLLALWQAAATALRPSYGAFIAPNAAGHGVVSLSPELFLCRRGREVITRPIKGTAPRESDPVKLAGDPKNRAENVMIVDLMRNDLGRVCAYGSVKVDELCAVRPAAGVWHLESTVSGRLAPDITDADLLRATFPPGSVTGAPKVQALRTIHELEGTARDTYCGAIGMVSPLTGLELNVAIRTFETLPGLIRLSAGGGVVSDSSPEAEVEEVLHKAHGVLDSVGFALYTDRGPGLGSAVITRAARPDAARGIFETLAVRRGVPWCIDEHLGRLEFSARALGLEVPPDLATRVNEAASGLGEGAVRIDVSTAGVTLSTRRLPGTGHMRLEPIVLPGGLGAHKWADRALIDAHTSPGATPLICDIDGTVLEAGYAAVLIAKEGDLWAPPMDGRVLRSLSRARLLRAAAGAGWRVRIRPFSLQDLRRAEAIVLTSTLRGPHPGAIDASLPTARSVSVSRTLADLCEAPAPVSPLAQRMPQALHPPTAAGR